MRKVQTAAIVLFCLWSLGMIVYSIIEVATQGREWERFGKMLEEVPASGHTVEGPGTSTDQTDVGFGNAESWVDAYIFPGPTTTGLVTFGALWFFPAFFFLCVFLFAWGIRRSPAQCVE